MNIMQYGNSICYFVFYGIITFLLVACSLQPGDPVIGSDGSNGEISMFNLVSSSKSRVAFRNELIEGLNTNILMYEYFYNGGGVAVGDFNGDDLPDLYFSSNMGDNKFYLNRGELIFQDITSVSGATGRPGPWKTGVNAVDINGDGRLDLYVCYSGALPEVKRKNELYINLGNNEDKIPVFEEQSEKYGLDSPAFSTQSYFFDYDRDGDLDMLLLNHNPKNLPILNEVKTKNLLGEDDPLRGVRLYENENDRFIDVTIESGISGSALTYGLGIGIGDFNNDGWPDFYVSNDYAVPDYLYINQEGNLFVNELERSMGHISHFSMGNDIADVNNDGYLDVITLDMLPDDNRRQKLLLSPDDYAKFDLNIRSGFHSQYMRNMLQLNNGNGTFSEIGQLAGISNTDWSWSALLADYDNDGIIDLYVTNGYFRDYTNLDFISYMDDFVKKKGRLMREDVIDIVQEMPASNVKNYMYKGLTQGRFENATASWSLEQPANSNGAAYADLDNDGDIDIVVNNINQEAFIYENKAREISKNNFLQIELAGSGLNPQGIGARAVVYSRGKMQLLEQFPSRGYQSSVSQVLHFGLGKEASIDSLVIRWPSGKLERQYELGINTRIRLSEANAIQPPPSLDALPGRVFEPIDSPLGYAHIERKIRDFDRQPLLISEISNNGPCIVTGDINGDDLADIFVGGTPGRPGQIFVQQPDQSFAKDVKNNLYDDADSEDSDGLIFDANGDGNLDLYVATGGYHSLDPEDIRLRDRLYMNDGAGKLNMEAQALPDIRTSNSCVSSADINRDGHPDLFVGGRVIPGRYPEIPESVILINDGTGKFENRTHEIAPELTQLGLVTDSEWTDIDGDGDDDLIVVGEWMPISVFINRNGKLENSTSSYFNAEYFGFWNAVEVQDFNGDGKSDVLAGNLGENIQFHASDTEPVEMYFSDFDRNGAVDPIFCYFIQGESYPYITRDELKRQLASLGSKFTSFESYADATIQDLFSRSQLSEAGYLKVNHLKTSLFLSRPDGTFGIRELPVEAQYAPVHAIHTLDYNGDGNLDLLLCGNNSKFKLRLGKSDANYGQLFRGNGLGEFVYIDQTRSGLRINGDVREIISIDDFILFGVNEKPLVAYKLNKQFGKESEL